MKLWNYIPKQLATSFVVSLTLTYFWVLQVFFYTNYLNRFVYLIPSLLFSCFVLYLLFEKTRLRFKESSYLLLLFWVGSVFTGLYQLELEIVVATSIFLLPILAVNEELFTINRKLVNRLFLLTIMVGIVSFHVGFNEYGYLPGHSFLNGKSPWWRISMFPTSTPTVSSFFALIVYVYNIKHSSLKSKILKSVAIYFLILSGSRTAILIFAGIVFYRYFNKKTFLKYWLPYILILIPIIVLTSEFIFSLSSSEIGSKYLLRGHSYTSEQQLQSFERFILWENLLQLFAKNPILGLGSFDFYSYFPFAPSHSESKWLSLLTSNGIFVFFLFFFFAKRYYRSVRYHKDFEAFGIMMILVAMFYYGSFYNPYNIIYFLNILLLNNLNMVYD